MADSSRILSGSYKGAPFTIDGGSLAGGRKVAVKQFPGRDTQAVEDLGLKPRGYSLDIIIADKPGQEYFAYRDSLIAVLEQGGPGELIHPLYGRIEGAVAVSYSLNERFSEFGAATISVQFELSRSTGIPTRSANVVTELATANETVKTAARTAIVNDFKVSSPDNFTAAVNNVTDAVNASTRAASFRGENADGISEYIATVNNVTATVNQAIAAPSQLADNYDAMLAGINNLYVTAEIRFDAYRSFFGFGASNGTAVKTDTASRIERKKNADTLAAAVNAYALGYAYLAGPEVDFQTTDDIDELTAQLDDQYILVMESEADQSIKDSLTDMRVKTLQALDAVRLDTSQIISVETLPTSARLLAFSYYGADALGEIIANLNRIDDVSFVSGPVRILTE